MGKFKYFFQNIDSIYFFLLRGLNFWFTWLADASDLLLLPVTCSTYICMDCIWLSNQTDNYILNQKCLYEGKQFVWYKRIRSFKIVFF